MKGLMTDPGFLAARRALVKTRDDLLGIDFVDVERVGKTSFKLHVQFLGKGSGVEALGAANLAITPNLPTAPEKLDYSVSAEGNARLTLAVDGITAPVGHYILQLLPTASANDASTVAIAPFFDRAEFRFDVDNIIEKNVAVAPNEGPVPLIDYRARDFRGIRSLMLDRIATLLPHRDEHHPADLLTVLVESVAHVADQLSYYQDAVATEAYLGTARRRISVRRHARLLGYLVHEGVNARLWAALRVDPSAPGPVEVPQGTPLLSALAAAQAVLSPADYQRTLDSQTAVVFETMHAATLFPQCNQMPLYTWGARRLALEPGTTSVHLAGDFTSVLQPGDVLVLEQEGPQTSTTTSAPQAHAVRVVKVDAAVDPLGGALEAATTTPSAGTSPAAVEEQNTPLTHITWHRDDALPFRMWVVEPELGLRTVATGNIVLADHGRSLQPEPLSPLPHDATKPFRPRLRRRGLTHAVPYDHDLARQSLEPATIGLITSPPDALPYIELDMRDAQPTDSRDNTTAGDQVWRPRRDLLDESGDTRAFVVEMEADRVAWLRFGDGIYGASPTTELIARYRVGGGLMGNVGARVLAHVVSDVPGLLGVTNPLPALGGAEPETMQQVRIRAPQAHRNRPRATTASDYAVLARSFPGVARATASASRGRPVPITLRVERVGGQPLTPTFVAQLHNFLEPERMMGHRLHILPARYLGIDVTVTATTEAGLRTGPVRLALAQAFSNLDFGGGRRGVFHPERFDFGTALSVGDLQRRALDVPGIFSATVDARPFLFDAASAVVIREGMIRPQSDQILRVDNDPDTPEYGSLTLNVREGVTR